MPNMDGTGPQGQGPQTGRGRGNCAGGKGQGMRAGPRDGSGWRAQQGNCILQNKDALKAEIKFLQDKLAELEQ